MRTTSRGPSPIVSVEMESLPTRTSWMRSSGSRPPARRNMPSKPTARSRSPRTYRRRCENASIPLMCPSRSSSQVCGVRPDRHVGLAAGPPGADAAAVGGAADLPGAADVARAGRARSRRSPRERRGSAPAASGTPGRLRRSSRLAVIGAANLPRRIVAAPRTPAKCARSASTTAVPVASSTSSRASPGKVGIYACGPTVYGRIHVGNARPFVVFSLLKRFLEHEGYETTLVANVTDINDKIYDAAARRRASPPAELAREMTAAYFADTDGLGLGRPDGEPLATETVPEIIALIEALIEREHAYERGGDVYFRVRSHAAYGELSHRDVDQMDQGEGIEGADRKEDPLDFALWKATKETEDTAWDSPWGRGRPGWHIECSAMAEKLLGLDFEIHGGGADLLFPHHENEAAQTLAGPRRAARPRVDAQRDDRAGHEDVEVARQHRRAARGAGRASAATRWSCTSAAATTGGRCRGATTCSRTPARAWSASARRAGGWCPGDVPGRPAPSTGRRSSPRWPTTSTRRRRWRPLHAWVNEANRRDGRGGRGPARDARRARPREPARRRRRRRRPELADARPAARGGARRRATSPPPTASATSCAPPAGRSATARTAPSSSPLA